MCQIVAAAVHLNMLLFPFAYDRSGVTTGKLSSSPTWESHGREKKMPKTLSYTEKDEFGEFGRIRCPKE